MIDYRLIIKPAAEADLQEAVSWYDEQRVGLGQEFLESVQHTLAQIAESPLLFPVVHHGIRRALTRRFPYALFYVLEEDTLVLLGVFHTSRDPARWRERR